jgi:hypothetical protein
MCEELKGKILNFSHLLLLIKLFHHRLLRDIKLSLSRVATLFNKGGENLYNQRSAL